MKSLQGLELGAPAPLQIVAAANKYTYMHEGEERELIICGHRHFDMIMHSQLDAIKNSGMKIERRGHIQGFIDNRGAFHDRTAALAIATAAGQINRVRLKSPPYDELFSEDLY